MLFGLLALFTGSVSGCHEFGHLQIGPGGHDHVAAELRGLAADRGGGAQRRADGNARGAVMRKLKRLVLSVPCRMPLIAARPIGARRGIEIRGRAFDEGAEIGEPFAEAGRIGLRDVQLDGAAGSREPANDSSPATSIALAITGIVAQAVRPGVAVTVVVQRHALGRAQRVGIEAARIEIDAQSTVRTEDVLRDLSSRGLITTMPGPALSRTRLRLNTTPLPVTA